MRGERGNGGPQGRGILNRDKQVEGWYDEERRESARGGNQKSEPGSVLTLPAEGVLPSARRGPRSSAGTTLGQQGRFAGRVPRLSGRHEQEEALIAERFFMNARLEIAERVSRSCLFQNL